MLLVTQFPRARRCERTYCLYIWRSGVHSFRASRGASSTLKSSMLHTSGAQVGPQQREIKQAHSTSSVDLNYDLLNLG